MTQKLMQKLVFVTSYDELEDDLPTYQIVWQFVIKD